MIPIPLLLGGISAILSLFSAAKNASDSAASGRRGGQQQGGQGGLPQGALQIPKFDPQTMQGLHQLLSMGLQGWGQNQPDFGPIKQNALNTFNSDIVPTIAERFAGTSRRSSGLEGSLGAAGAGLASNLGAMEQGFNQNNRSQLLQLLQLGTQPQYDNAYKTRQPGFAENLATSAAPSLIQNAPQLWNMFQGSN
jgi:hypothetical protein